MFTFLSMHNNMTSPDASDGEICVSATDYNLVPKKCATSTTSNRTQYFCKIYEETLFPNLTGSLVSLLEAKTHRVKPSDKGDLQQLVM